MVQLRKPWVRVTLVVALTLIGVFGVAGSVLADSIVIDGETIPAGEVVDNDAIITGEDVVVDGTVNGDLLAIGATVTINGSVNGSLVVAGQEVTINGEVEGTVYSAGGRIELGPEADLNRNAYALGLRIVTESGSQVGRDLVVRGLGAQFSGQVGREMDAVIGFLEILDIIRDALTSAPGEADAGPQITGWPDGGGIGPIGVDGDIVSIANLSERRPPGRAALALDARYRVPLQEADEENGSGDTRVRLDRVGEWILGRLEYLAILFVIGGLAAWLMPSRLDGWTEGVRKRPLPSFGFGLLSLILGFFGSGFLVFFIFAVGIWLGFTFSWTLSFVVWMVGFSSLIVGLFIFGVFVAYMSKVNVAYAGGDLILARLVPRAAGHRVWTLLLGLVLYVLIVAIPIFGLIVALIATVLGLGAVWVAFLERRRAKKLEAASAAPELRVDETPAAIVEAVDVTDVEAEPVITPAMLEQAREDGQKRADREIQDALKNLGRQNGPWSYNEALGSSASTPFDRAALAVGGILAASKEQNVYYVAGTDSEGNPLGADSAYKITGKDLPARWWSVTAYNPDYLIPNEQNKYSVSKSTITLDEEGNWEAYLTSEPREDEGWIHTGGEADLALVLRLYNPSPEAVADMGAVELPEIHPVALQETAEEADANDAAGPETEGEESDD